MTYVLLQMVFPSTARCGKILNIKNGNERTFLGWRPWALRQPDWPQQSYNSYKLVLVSLTLPAIILVSGGKVETAYPTIRCVCQLWWEINMLSDIFLRWYIMPNETLIFSTSLDPRSQTIPKVYDARNSQYLSNPNLNLKKRNSLILMFVNFY